MDQMEIAKELSSQLCEAATKGDLVEVRSLLAGIEDPDLMNIIATQTDGKDPLLLAVENNHEVVALYLIEKGFNFRLVYVHPNKSCDQWCYSQHGTSKCPAEYDVLDLAKRQGLVKVVQIIEDISLGVRNPGDGLSLKKSQTFVSSSKSNKVSRGVNYAVDPRFTNKATQAKDKVDVIGMKYISKVGDTIMHEAARQTAAMVYVCANRGANVNAHNFDGDTPLHIAVREGSRETVLALLMSGADPNARNKLGQSPLDHSLDDIKPVLGQFRCGLGQAATRCEQTTLQRLIRLWVNPNSIIKNGMSVADILNTNQKGNATPCRNLMNTYKKTLELIHAVLAEDISRMKNILESGSEVNVNMRYKDNKGQVPISCAIEQQNLQIVQILINTGKCNLELRVRENEKFEDTVPILFKALHRDCPIEILKLITNHMGPKQFYQKDKNGNTALLRAIENGCSQQVVEFIIMTTNGLSLMNRNKNGKLPRDVALQCCRPELACIIDKYITCSLGNYFLIQLPIHFYGQHNLQLTGENDKPLEELVKEYAQEDDVLAITKYAEIESKGINLFNAAVNGDLETVSKEFKVNYVDVNGYTAMIRAIVFNQVKVVELLCTRKPALRYISDNCGRSPLHYAYSLPDDQGAPIVKLLLQKDPEAIEERMDKDGRVAAEYKKLRYTNSDEIGNMLWDARTLGAYGQRCSPLGPLPDFAENRES